MRIRTKDSFRTAQVTHCDSVKKPVTSCCVWKYSLFVLRRMENTQIKCGGRRWKFCTLHFCST